MLHEELNQGFHRLELLPLRGTGAREKQNGYDVGANLLLCFG